jgi:hypothetical protein
MDADDIVMCRKEQIGFRWLLVLGMVPSKRDPILGLAFSKRSEFASFQEKWGTSKNYFTSLRDDLNFEILMTNLDDNIIGFSYKVMKGKLIYLPCQRDFYRPDSVVGCFNVLIPSLITYLTRSRTEIPAWAEEPFLRLEVELQTKILSLQSEIDTLRSQLEPYQSIKQLAFLSEYDFEEAVPHFFRDYFEISVEREEKYKEDFWLLDTESKKVVIAETKSGASRGLKKSDIYALHNHREANGLEETFPGLLVVNFHLTANSWKDKLRPIAPQEYRVAADHYILVVRVEDLLFLWNAVSEGKISKQEILSLICENKGWMEVLENGTIKIHDK